MTWRLGSLVGALVLVVSTSGCGNLLDKEPSSARIPVGCGDCAEEIAALVNDVEKVDGVDEVRSTRLMKRGVPGAYLSVSLDLVGKDIVSTDITAVTDAVAEVAWHSDVTPLDNLSLAVELRNGYNERDGYDFGADRASFEERWGPRPAGSEWSPVQEKDDDLEGCEVDGCDEQMRAIAREVSALPGVEAVIHSDYAPDDPTSSASTNIEVRGDGADLAEQVAEVVWRSEVGPIVYISVTVDTPDGGFPDTIDFQIDPDHGRDHDRLEQMWGPRPVE